MILSLALAATSIAYYYVIYLPARDALQDARREDERNEARRQAAARADEERRTQDEREHREAQERSAAELRKFMVEARYKGCLQRVSNNYSAMWDNYCKQNEEQRRKDYQSCITSQNQYMNKEICNNLHGTPLPETNCKLRHQVADDLNSTLEREKNRCFQEFQAGLE